MAVLGTPSFRMTLGEINFESKLDVKNRVIKIEVNCIADNYDKFSVELDDSDGKFLKDYRGQIKESGTAKIALGYSGKDYFEVMDGYITKIEARRLSREKMIVVVSGCDYLHKLTRGQHRRNWFNKKDSEVATEIAGEVGLDSSGVEASSVVHLEILQNNTTNLTFLFERATRCGFEVDCIGKKLIFARPKKKSPVCDLIWDHSNFVASNPQHVLVQSCDFETETSGQIKKVVVQGYDPATNAMIEGSSDSIVAIGSGKEGPARAAENAPEDQTVKVVTNQPVRSVEDAEKLAWSILNQQAGFFVKADGECRGYGKIKPGEIVKMDAFGDGMDGDYIVTGATHTFDAVDKGYITQFELRRTNS
jgi:phage protein D